ncbi:Zn-dependent protease with chaperone function [Rhodobacteraceae bacterium MBR-64]
MRPIAHSLSVFALALAACAPLPEPAPGPAAQGPVNLPPPGPKLSPNEAARTFASVVRRMEPVTEAECRARVPRANCDFDIRVDTRAGVPANAYQSLDNSGRPVITFTLPLITETRNADEIAFILGHESAHHIMGHIPRGQQTAMTGAILLGTLVALGGGSASSIDTAQQIGAGVGGRTFSKNYELEADQLGTVITHRAGYDPMRGAAFFARIPDPGNQFLGSHPPNASRLETVRRTAAQLR